jgi:Ca-activated chloride channel family protein
VKAEPRRLSRALVLTALALLTSLSVSAQTAEPPAPTPTPAPEAAAPTPAPPTVRLGLTVVDDKNRMADDVRREDVRVFEDGVEQAVGSFEKESPPASYGLVVDNSGSVRSRIHLVIAAAKFIAASNRPDDETFLVRFIDSRNISVFQGMTANTAAVQRALEEMFVEGGQTAVIDAVYTSAEYLLKNSKPAGDSPRRRALVLISDGEDRASYYKLDQLLTLLREGDIQVFCVGFVTDLERGDSFGGGRNKRDKAESLLQRLAAETGGRAFFPGNVKELQEAAEEVVKNLRTQYVVGYAPTEAPTTKASRKIEVRLAETKGKAKRKAVHRPGRPVAGKDASVGKKKGGR